MTTQHVTIYQLRVAMADITPPIWRLIEVPADFSLDWLHDIVQWAMDWEHQHPYRFYGGEFAYVERPQVHAQQLGKELDAKRHTLGKVFGNRHRYLRYVYDMDGDSWWHHIWLEDTFPSAMEVKYPRLAGGDRTAPPEGFGGIDDYRAYLRGDLDDERLDEMTDFDPEAFDPEPRPFPNARTYVQGQQVKSPSRPVAFQPRAAETLGEMHDRAEEILEAAEEFGHEFRADLRRALEDVTLAEDALPPKTADTLQRARSEDLGVEEFLIDCIRRHRTLGEHYSTAPLHAAHLLSFWKVEQAVDVFHNVLFDLGDTDEGMIDTMVRAMVWSGQPGVEALLEELDALSTKKRHVAIDKLCREGIRDDRLFDHLGDLLAEAGPEEANVPYLLSQYDDDRATDLLHDALDEEIEYLADHPEADDEDRARRTDYALFLTEMLAARGETLEAEQWEFLDELEDFYWPSPAYRKRLRR